MAVKRTQVIVKRGRREVPLEGVYQRVSPKHGIGYDIVYRYGGKVVWERIGWRKTGYTPEMAATIRAERIRAKRHGEELPTDKRAIPFFGKVAEEFLEWSKGNLRSYIQDENRYRLHLKGRFGKKRMDKISPFHLEKLKLELKDELSPQSIKHILRLVSRIYRKAVKWGLYSGENPVGPDKAEMPEVRNERTRYLTPEEARILLDELKKNPWTKKHEELKDPVLHDIATLSLFTGARAGEIFFLRGRDLNLSEGFVSFMNTKNGITRHVPMPDTLREILKKRMPENPSDYVFPSKKGERIKEVSHAFDRAVERLGLNEGASSRDRVTFHTLRHTFCSWAVLSGTPLRTVMDLSGHKSLAMLQRYAHLSGEDRRRATSAVEGMFRNNGNVVSIDEAEK